MKRFPAAFLSIISIIALAGMGVTYTLWADKLEVKGVVNTGVVDVIFAAGTTATEVVGNPNHNPGGSESASDGSDIKDVGKCSSLLDVLNGDGPSQNQGSPAGNNVGTGPDAVTVTLDNAYPYYICNVHLVVQNVGTIPVKLQAFDLGTIPSALTITQGACWTAGYQLEALGYENATNPPGPSTATCDLQVTVQQSADEHATYSFGASFLAKQWNEFS